jgi:hypothetical protein
MGSKLKKPHPCFDAQNWKITRRVFMRGRIYGILVQKAVTVTPVPGATSYVLEELSNRRFGGSVFVAVVVIFGDTLIAT